jgi:nucleotide-binding universal stress UspA family protein
MHGRSDYRILLPIDGSEQSLRAAEYLAACAGCVRIGAVLVINVQSIDEQAAIAAVSEGRAPDHNARGRQASAAARAQLDRARVPNNLTTLLGEPGPVIVRAAEEEDVDEVVMGSRSHDRLGDVMGSVAYKVVHNARTPVTIVPAGKRGTSDLSAGNPHRILLAADGSEHAKRAVDFVCALQSASRPLEIHVLYSPAPAIPGYVRSLLTDEALSKLQDEERQRALDPAVKALKSAGLRFEAHAVPGDPADRIVDQAARLHCGRIVMGTRGLGAVSGLVLGSVAYKVLHLARMPVTLVK